MRHGYDRTLGRAQLPRFAKAYIGPHALNLLQAEVAAAFSSLSWQRIQHFGLGPPKDIPQDLPNLPLSRSAANDRSEPAFEP